MSPDSESHEYDPRLFHTPLGITQASESNLVFFGNSCIEVMRIDRHGVKVNPDIPVDDAAKAVLAAIDTNIKHMVAIAVQAEREACAKVCDEHADDPVYCGAAIRAREEYEQVAGPSPRAYPLAQPEQKPFSPPIFCPRCGKPSRTLEDIHTCTPPKKNT